MKTNEIMSIDCSKTEIPWYYQIEKLLLTIITFCKILQHGIVPKVTNIELQTTINSFVNEGSYIGFTVVANMSR